MVVDSSAVLAWLYGEPGDKIVDTEIDGAKISAVNLAEVEGKLIERGMPELDALGVVRNLPCEVVPFDMDMAILAGAMQQRTRRQGLSLGDRACLALALREGLPVLTADRAWAQVEVGVEIRMLR